MASALPNDDAHLNQPQSQSDDATVFAATLVGQVNREDIPSMVYIQRDIEIVENYGEHAMSMTQVYHWCSWFKDSRTSLQDEPRSGHPNTANNDWNTARVDELIKVDRRVKLKEISLKLDIPKTNVYEIVHDKLGYRKVSATWVPKTLSDEQKRQRVEIYQILLHRSQQKVDMGPGGDHRTRNKLLEHLITGDEIWLHLSTPETKWDSMTWKHPSSPLTKNFKVQQSATIVMATVFRDS
ncbi:histone-lysine N-methyltransferase SETMAR [Plakobranchus ocellatus]|uniref:Histone-lysine N-methyltransferase SETMAR n=1 Tax=Plakobranchus ocellatus TaxID=259542 RepID=A0AAV4CIS6_9GAST|nr:histone-lysine N-methyltransferase SETMAR [Plakobranchus ocellatus]